MTEPTEEPLTLDDKISMIAAVLFVLFLFSLLDGCRAGVRYRDLRDRLERMEQQELRKLPVRN